MKFSPYTAYDTKKLLTEFGVTAEKGLSKDRARELLRRFGQNEVEEKGVSAWSILLRQFRSVFIYLLLAAGALTFALGEYTDTAFIFLFIVINAVLGFRQEFHSERTISILRKYFSFKTKVRRNGAVEVFQSTDIVPGDIVELEAGDRIPADVRYIETASAQIDESALTGESAPVSKIAAPLLKEVTDIYRAQNIGFAGTTLVSGEAVGVVIATGNERVMEGMSAGEGKAAREGSFERGLSRFSARMLYVVFGTLLIVFCANYYLKPAFSTYDFVVFAIALTISVVPEALPLVMTFSLSRGAMRLVKKKVVVKRLPAVEELGSIEVLASDKTGTLTENSLTVSKIKAANPKSFLLWANLCSSVDAKSLESSDNSFDKALYKSLSPEDRTDLSTWERVAEIPFDPVRRRNSVLVAKGHESRLIVMGAPETILKFCGSHGGFSEELAWIKEESEHGRRVIVVASKVHARVSHYSPHEEEHGLLFEGLVSFVDPIKPSTHEAVAHAKKLGVILKIITGDNKLVAGAVASEIGLIQDVHTVLTGEEFRALSSEERLKAVEDFHVFARVAPDEKRLIVEALKQNHEVGFLGEAMNDVRALRAADVSIVVESASDIARSAADIILLKKDLSVIVNGIREGRQVFTNTVKYLKATLLSNVGNFFAVAIASLMIDTLPLLPIQILLLNLLSDFPMMVIATDSVDTAELARPKHYEAAEITTVALILGAVSTLFDFIFFAAFYMLSPEILRTNWFIGSILTELALIFSIRTRGIFWKGKAPSLLLIFASVAAFVVTIVLPFSAHIAPLLGFVEPSVVHLGFILSIVALYFVVTEVMKLVIYRHFEASRYNGSRTVLAPVK